MPVRLPRVLVRHETAPTLAPADIARKAVEVALRPKTATDLTPVERAHVEPLVKAMQWASGWTDRSATPVGARETRPVSAAVMARRAAEQLGPSSSVTPLDVALAMQAQGIDYALPFAPGRPLQPYYGFSRRPRQYNYQTARNTTTTTRPDRIPFRTLLELWKSYDVAQICYRYSANSLRSIRVRFQAMDGYEKNPFKDIKEAKRRLRRPDGKRLFRNWVTQNQRNVWIFDSAPIYRQRDRAGRVTKLRNFSAQTLAPMLDYFGDFPDAPAPAFEQFVTGIPWDLLTWNDVIYEPFWPETDSPYGTPPLETVLINANTDVRLQLFFLDFFCYDDKTEVLTRQGWRKFADLDGSEEYATRSPEGRFEWQRTTDGQVHRFDYEGDLVRFHSNCVDQLVTPNHRMLVRRVPATPTSPRNPSNDWHIRRADYFVEHPTAEFHVPLTSEWEGTDPGAEIVLTADAAKRGRPQEVRMPSWAWAEFLGLFIAEGWCRKDRRDVLVSQFPNGDLDEVRRILKNTGLNWLYSPSNGTFSCSTKAIWTALQEVDDGAPNKRIPTGAMEWTPRLLRHLLRGLIIGDGHVTPSGQKVYTTTSRVLADQVQELWQKIGTYARVDTYEPDPRTFAKLVQYKVRTNPKEVFRVPRPTLEPYSGKVSCVSVPNGIVFVRREGQAMWCGNTKGQVPEAIAKAPENMTSPDDLADFQEQWTADTYGDQSRRWGLKWLPHGTELDFYKPMVFDPDLAEYVMRRTVAAHLLTPQNLGILEDVNRAAATTQVDQEFRVSTLPTVGYYEDLFDSVLQDTWTLPVQLRFDTGREKEDRLTDVQAWSLGVQWGMVSPTEGRDKLFNLPVNPEERVGRGILDNRLGWIPLAHMLAVSGELDILTGAPKAGTVAPQPYQLPSDAHPVPAAGPGAAGGVGGTATDRGAPGGGDARPKGDPTKAYPRPLALQRAAKSALTPDAPLVAQGYVKWGEPHGSQAQGTGTVGPVELLDEADDLRKWHRQARRRIAGGKAPRLFVSDLIRPPVSDHVWKALETARTKEAVDAAFKQAAPVAGGLVVQAEDTGRVLLVQRTPDKHDAGEAYCRWEFPGGKFEHPVTHGIQDPWTGAKREWEEETGSPLPLTARHVGNWTSPDGGYVGFVLVTPRESDIHLSPQPEEVSAARWWAKDDLDDPTVRDKVTETLTRVMPMLKGWTTQPRGATGRFTTEAEHTRAQVHARTTAAVQAFVPYVRRALVAALRGASLSTALSVAGVGAGAGVRAATTMIDNALDSRALRVVLGSLYVIAYADGAHAGAYLGGARVSGSPDLTPGEWAAEIRSTLLSHIEEIIGVGVAAGKTREQLAAEISEYLSTEWHARQITDTEYMRAWSQGAMASYVAGPVDRLTWVPQPGACSRCMENVAASPQPASDPQWPQGPIPVHPHTRCIVVPYLGGSS